MVEDQPGIPLAGKPSATHLREAHRLYTEMAATGHAERVAKELGEV